MDHNQGDVRELIRSGGAILGIELGSTRIKAALVAPDTTPLASGAHAWENRLEAGVWTYDLADIAAKAHLLFDTRGKISGESVYPL